MLDDAEPEVAEGQRRQARAMFRMADEEGCRHERLVGHFGERIDPCGDACDRCTGEDALASAPAVRARRGARRAERPGRPADGGGGEAAEADLALFEALRAWRAAEAKERGVPAFVVFADATLMEIALQRPRDEGALLEVKGLGPRKLETYGAAILALVRAG